MYVGNNNLKFIILLLVLVISISILPSATFASIVINTNVNSLRALEQLNDTQNALAKSFARISGQLQNLSASDDASGLGKTNVTGCVGSLCNWTIANSSGHFNFTLIVPLTPGPFNFTISTNSSSIQNKTIPITVTSELGSVSSITYHQKFPPFTAGTTFTINVTLKNSTQALQGITPNVSVYPANGPKASWTIVNKSASTDSNGLIQFNITVPSSATSGDYAIIVDNGAIFSSFQVGSGYVMAVQTLTTQGEVSSFFPRSSTVSVLAKLRDTSGTPVTGATVSAIITFPNGTVSSPVILSANSASSGYYNNTFTDTSASGAYKIKVTATISGTNVTGSGIFNTQIFTASLQPQKSFFFEWGGQGSFKPNSTFALDIVPTNLADGSTITNATCPGSSYNLVDLTYANGTSVLNTVFANALATNYSFIVSNSPSGSVCAIQFGNATVPSNISIADVYNAKVNLTIAGESHTINGFFTIQNYFLKVVPVLSLGGEDNFMQVVSPGSTITLALKVANVTSGAALAPSSITNHIVTSILPLEFSSGTNETTSITQTSTAGSGTSTDPTINMNLPSNMQGPLLIKVQATVAGQTITGNAFVIANYLMGGVSPQGVRGGDLGMGGPGEGGGPSGGAGMLCSGTKQFNGNVQDAATGTAAQGATVVGIMQAREAETGKDVSSFLSIAAATASDSSGQMSANITFNPGSYSFTGDYFIVLNATYKNVSAGVPGFFQCKNLNTGFPQITTAGTTSSMGFTVSPSSGLILSFNNVTNMTGSLINNTSTVGIRQIFNFNPGSGAMKVLVNNTPLFATFYNNGGTVSANITFYPQNFSVNGVALTQWPNGFFDVRPTIIASITGSTSGTVSETSHGGFQVVAFNAFPETFGFGSASVGSVQSTIIDIQANGTWNRTGGWNSTIYIGSIGGSDIVNNNTFVNVTIGRPWEGEMTTITGVNATLLSDGWNSPSDSNNFTKQGGPFERWNITYTIPTTVSKGFAMVTITVNATTNGNASFNRVDIPLALSVAKYNVIIPSQEGVGDSGSGSGFDGFGIAFDPASPNPNKITQSAFGNWSPTLNSVLGFSSASGVVCVKNNFSSVRYGNGPSQNIQYFNVSTRVMVLDRATAGTYDTVVLNITNGTNPNAGVIVVLNASQRNATFPDGTGGVYLWQIDNCGYFTVVNTSKSSIAPQGSFVQSYGGSHQKNTNFTIPYVVALGGASTPTFQSGNSVGIKGIGQQNPGKNGGFGFAGKLTSGTDYITGGSVVTDANGVAFVTVNVSTTGQFMAFWNVTVSGDTDAADFSSATFFDARAFNAYTNTINSTAIYRVVMLSNSTAGGTMAGTSNRYFGSTNTVDGTLYVEYNITDEKFAMSFNTPTNPGSSITVTNQTLSMMGGSSYNVAWITPNTTTGSTNNRTILIFKNSNFQSGVISVQNATQNVTISVCGQGFSGQPPAIVTNMTVNNVTVQDWAHGASTKLLTMYELMNNTNVTGTGVLAGPDGCALLNVGPGQLGSWPAASGFAPPVFANAYVTNNADSQQIYVANIFRTG